MPQTLLTLSTTERNIFPHAAYTLTLLNRSVHGFAPFKNNGDSFRPKEIGSKLRIEFHLARHFLTTPFFGGFWEPLAVVNLLGGNPRSLHAACKSLLETHEANVLAMSLISR